jgi:glyoxylase-like metal-dependent hydrolase (beta-lactamase superfamily II)
MKQITDDLWQSEKTTQGILSSHAYLYTGGDENVIFYNLGKQEDIDAIEQLGGAKYQMLTHRDEATPSLRRLKGDLHLTLCASEKEQPFVERFCPVDEVIDNNTYAIADVSIIHTPGHTDGSVCFYTESNHGIKYLFTGDTIFQWDFHWKTFVISEFGGTKVDLINSLKKLQCLNPDYVMSSGFIKGNAVNKMQPGQWQEVVKNTITQLAL